LEGGNFPKEPKPKKGGGSKTEGELLSFLFRDTPKKDLGNRKREETKNTGSSENGFLRTSECTGGGGEVVWNTHVGGIIGNELKIGVVKDISRTGLGWSITKFQLGEEFNRNGGGEKRASRNR